VLIISETICKIVQYNMPESKTNKLVILHVCRTIFLLIEQSVENIDEAPHSEEDRNLQKELQQTHERILANTVV
jgi:hypothetical protein